MRSVSSMGCLGAAVALVLLCSCSGPAGSDVNTAEVDYVVFQDPDSDFNTSDVRDIDGEIVRFDAVNQQLIWIADEIAFDGWDINGNALRSGFFTVRFGTAEGQQRAYFTETDPPTICDIVVQDANLQIFPTTTPVPQE